MIDLSRLNRVLAFFAHPDDEVLGAGGLIAKLSDLRVITHVAIPATGLTSRRESPENLSDQLQSLQADCNQAMDKLGVERANLTLGDFPDNQMDNHALLELIHWLESLIDKVQPDMIVTHHRYCTNIDHQYCHEAAVVATRPDTSRHIPLLCAEVPSSTGYLRPASWEPNFYVELSTAQLKRKIDAMQCYTSEARPDPHPRSPEALSALAKVRGSESGFNYAESFMIQRVFA